MLLEVLWPLDWLIVALEVMFGADALADVAAGKALAEAAEPVFGDSIGVIVTPDEADG